MFDGTGERNYAPTVMELSPDNETIDPNNYRHRLMRLYRDGTVGTFCGFIVEYSLKFPDGTLKLDCPLCDSAQYDPFPPRRFLPYF